MESALTFQITDKEFDAIARLVYQRAGIHLTSVKKNLVVSRLSRRLRTLDLPDFTAYLEHLGRLPESDPEYEELINRISTNKTDFFREPVHIDFVREKILPTVKHLDLWSAACSSGEEPYSLAIMLQEAQPFVPFTLTASDISTKVLGEAQEGLYELEKLAPVSKPLLAKYFLKGTGRWEGYAKVKPILSQSVHFRQVNLMDAKLPFSASFDVIFLRNVLIYFDRPTKQALLSRLESYLKPGGHLLLGLSDSLIGVSDHFTALGHSIYRFERPRRGAP
ncbi:MAG: methyltransferase domain-containing protein [Spirochaetes bacterium]|nr:methyltransferase domain-containing protein [Spirochaetota bacterium]